MLDSTEILRTADGKVSFLGMEHPPAEIVSENGEFMVLKIKGHPFWSGRGQRPKYAGAEYHVIRLGKKTGKTLYGDQRQKYEPVIDWKAKKAGDGVPSKEKEIPSGH